MDQLPSPLSALHDLALDLRWTWSHEADALWERVNPALWEQTHSPWTMLHAVPPGRFAELAADSRFLTQLNDLSARRRAYRERPTWFGSLQAGALPGLIAYFSMEFGLGSALPLYAGGLGVLAGDVLKTASDLGVPLLGVGLLYAEGYFRQRLDAAGRQRESFPYNDPATLPIKPVLSGQQWLTVPVDLPGRTVRARVWRATVGVVDLYLLDCNDPLNAPADRALTGKLYADDPETRLGQELVLGVGGWRALRAIGRAPDICHINEGHAAFALLERALGHADRHGLTFDEALWATRSGNVFTSHTAVAAAFDHFEPSLARRCLGTAFGLSDGDARLEQVMALGREDQEGDDQPFNTVCLAMRASGRRFGVSAVHACASRRIFAPLYPRWPLEAVPVGHITNGVHTPTWDSEAADRVWTEACGKERWRAQPADLAARIAAVPDETIWAMRGEHRQDLVRRVRLRLSAQVQAQGLGAPGAQFATTALDPNVLTLGFARRFTDYKRPNLLLHDPDRFARMVLDSARPLQLVLAGKAHPEDEQGKSMIREWVQFARKDGLQTRIIFLEDYDHGLAQELVQGVDVWINTPRRPWEACGTSGMKVLVNGGLNCSVLDGWWAEAFAPDLGWAIGAGEDNADGSRDVAEAELTYDLIERHIAVEFYERDQAGVPRAWVERIRRSMAQLTSRFSSGRMLSDYLELAYRPAAEALGRRADGTGAAARALSAWAERLRLAWSGLHIAEPTVHEGHPGFRLTVPVYLGDLLSADVAVELYAEPQGEGPAEVIRLEPLKTIPGALNGWIYEGSVATTRGASDFTVRVRPEHPLASADELPLMAWRH